MTNPRLLMLCNRRPYRPRSPGRSPIPSCRRWPRQTSRCKKPISVVDGGTLPGTEPVASLKPSAGPAGEPLQKVSGQQLKAKTVESGSVGVSEQVGPDQGQPYTWQDGDRTLTVLLQDDLTVTQDGDIASKEDIAARTTRSDTVDKAASAGLPVFRSQSGSLMTLPGGVLLALDETWTIAETDAFFAPQRN